MPSASPSSADCQFTGSGSCSSTNELSVLGGAEIDFDEIGADLDGLWVSGERVLRNAAVGAATGGHVDAALVGWFGVLRLGRKQGGAP